MKKIIICIVFQLVSYNAFSQSDDPTKINGSYINLTRYGRLNFLAPGTNGQVLTTDGTTLSWTDQLSGADDWGTQVVETDATLTGNGTSGNPLSVASPYSFWSLSAQGGTSTSISDGESVNITGGDGLTASRSSNSITIDVDGYYSQFTTYSSAPGSAVAVVRGGVYAIDAVAFGWTHTLSTSNLDAGDEIIILIANADTNTITLDVDGSGTGGFIRPRLNGDFSADDTEAFTDAYSSLKLIWDGSNFWVIEN